MPEKTLVIRHLGYTDMLKASTPDVIYNYPISDMFVDEVRYYVNWNELISALQIPGVVYRKSRVGRLDLDNGLVDSVQANNIVIAVEKSGLEGLLKSSKSLTEVNDAIGSVPFVRAFCHTEPVELPGVTLTDLPVQRVIAFTPTVTMCIYADADRAEYWNRLGRERAAEAERQLQSLYKFPKFLDFVYKYWKDGIHYYKPGVVGSGDFRAWRESWIRRVMRPKSNVWVLGEMLSFSQGWVEGCVESVELAGFR